MKKQVLVDEKGKRHLWSNGDFHTKHGTLKEKDIKSKSELKTNKGSKYKTFPATFSDLTKSLKRGPAVMLPKDIGLILSLTGINSKSKVIESGTGSGFLTTYLANITEHVTSYERKEQFYKIAKENIKKLELKAKLKNKDVSDGITEKNIDVIILDLGEPVKVLPQAYKSLKKGGFLVCYLPHIPQTQELVKKALKQGFFHQLTTELIQRDWVIEGIKARPKNMGLMHTAFLTFLRKL